MRRRDFLRRGTAAAAGLAGSARVLVPLGTAREEASIIPKRRLGNTVADLSIIALGGMLLRDHEPSFVKNMVAEAFDRGVNYFDVAPEYGDAQQKLGPALEPYRQRSFLACKTLERSRDGAARELEDSLRKLRTDHFDLYQFHAVVTKEDVDKIFAANGAMEAFQAARQAGKVRFIGFSAHSVENALAMLEHYNFDTILLPINFVLFSQANFGPQVVERAHRKGIGILALKSMAKTVWPEAERKHHPHPNCWYQPAEFPAEATLALRWTLSQPITAAVPPGDEQYFRLAMDVAQHFEPIKPEEEEALMARAAGAIPLFHLANA